MSAANMGISQLECLQLRRLVGPSGIGESTYNNVGNRAAGTIVAVLPLTLHPDGTKTAPYISPFTVPSGTGIMRIQITTQSSGGDVLYYQVLGGINANGGFPTYLVANNNGSLGFNGWYYEGTMMYNNPTSAPIPVSMLVGTQGGVNVCNLFYFSVSITSFGPFVSQE
jgi:hypothetical protein